MSSETFVCNLTLSGIGRDLLKISRHHLKEIKMVKNDSPKFGHY